MTITAYAFPVLYDTSILEYDETPKTDQHGIFVIELEDDGKAVQAFLLNRNYTLCGCVPQILNPVDYNANSWMMYNMITTRNGLIHTEGYIRVRVKPLPLNSPIGKIIRHEYCDIPLKTIRSFQL